MVGEIFLFVGLWPFGWRQEAVRIWVVVPGAILAVTGPIEARLSRRDVGRACDRLSQHAYYFGGPILWRGYADGSGPEIARP